MVELHHFFGAKRKARTSPGLLFQRVADRLRDEFVRFENRREERIGQVVHSVTGGDLLLDGEPEVDVDHLAQRLVNPRDADLARVGDPLASLRQRR